MWGIIYAMLVVSLWFRLGSLSLGHVCLFVFWVLALVVVPFFLQFLLSPFFSWLYAPRACFRAFLFALCASASASALRGRRILVFGGTFVSSLSRGVSSRRGVVLMFDATRLLRFVAGVGAGVPRACVLCAVFLGLIIVQPCGSVARLWLVPSNLDGTSASWGGSSAVCAYMRRPAV